jgi:hypothetical protein
VLTEAGREEEQPNSPSSCLNDKALKRGSCNFYLQAPDLDGILFFESLKTASPLA